MIRRILLSTLALLTACAQPTADPAPRPSLSTDLGDAATHVTTDALGNAYVLGYRNRPDLLYPETPRTSQLYLSRFDRAGALRWLTDLNQKDATATENSSETYGVAVTETGIYALTQQDSDADVGQGPVYLHKLTPDGALLWTRPILEAGAGREVDVTTFQKAPTGQLYVSWLDSGNEGQTAYLGSLDAEGTLRWSVVLRSEEDGRGMSDVSALQSNGEVRGVFEVAPSADGVYVTNTAQVRKYSAQGNLIWSQALAFEEYTHIGADLAVNGNSIYLVRNLTLMQDVVSYNSEIKRFNADGDELWTRTLVAPEVASTVAAYSSEPFGVSAGGKLYLLVASAQDADGHTGGLLDEQFLLQFSPDGRRSQRVRLSQEETILDMALVRLENPEHAHVTPSPKFLDYFYAVGREGLEVDCQNEFVEGEEARCKDTDAFVRLYAGPDSDASTSDVAVRPQWVRD